MQFEYLYTTQAMGTIDIENIGEVCISGVNAFIAQEYILIIKTEEGKSKIIQYGPRFIDLEIAPVNVSYTYNEIDYNQRKLITIIDKFINNPKFGISQVQLIELEEAVDRIKDLREFL
jgi:hypothetical protein